MDNVQNAVLRQTSPWKGPFVSITMHALLLAGVLGTWRAAPRIVPYKWPGTTKGVRMLTYFSPGSPQASVSDLHANVAVPRAKQAVHSPAAAKTAAAPAAASAQRGTGAASLSGLGDGDMRMAYQKVFPYPRPDLSTMPPGKSGDVILTAVIDQDGKVKDITLLSGLGSPIDDTVLSTVRQWSFTPATRNGTPVPSEQEFHFHYERG